MQLNLNGDSNLYEYDTADKEFVFPSNVKQMGGIDDAVRIYMEDYVYTYLYQYAKSSGNKEKLAALVGRHMVVDGQKVIVISGAIQGKATVQDRGVETFTEDTWEYIKNQMDVYFKGMDIVGWMHTQPGYGAFLMSRDEIYHREHFTEDYQVLYVLDPVEKLDAFFIHNSEKTGLKPARGYFIYYEKNEKMQEYMLDNALVRPKVSAEEEKELNKKENMEEKEEKNTEETIDRIDAASRIRKVMKEKIAQEEESKNKYSFLVGVSGVLCIACLMMGAGLIHNQDRIARLETEVVSVKTSYDTITAKINNSNIQTVFASQGEGLPVDTEMEDAAKTVEEINTQQIEEDEEKNENKGNANTDEPQSNISERTDSSSESVSKAQNNEDSSIEQTLPAEQTKPENVPEEQPSVAESAGASLDIPEYYVVEEGDNLGYISWKFYNTGDMVEEIMEANQIDNPDTIYYGKKIYLPKP